MREQGGRFFFHAEKTQIGHRFICLFDMEQALQQRPADSPFCNGGITALAYQRRSGLVIRKKFGDSLGQIGGDIFAAG